MSLLRKIAFAAGLALVLAAPVARAEDAEQPTADERLLIVNGNTDQVIYDDGYNDLFCVTRVHVVGYNAWGHRVYRRSMRCR